MPNKPEPEAPDPKRPPPVLGAAAGAADDAPNREVPVAAGVVETFCPGAPVLEDAGAAGFPNRLVPVPAVGVELPVPGADDDPKSPPDGAAVPVAGDEEAEAPKENGLRADPAG